MINKININKLTSGAYVYLRENDVILAVLSGLFLFFSFPKYGFGFMAWISLVPLFFAIFNAASIKRVFLLGFITGVTAYIGIIYWITYVVVNYGHLPMYLGIIIMLLLAGYLSIYIALFAAGVYFFRNKVILCFVAPALWVCCEYLKSCLFTGFPWANLGYSQYLNFLFIQFADVFGVYGLSFLIVSVNAVIFVLSKQKTKQAVNSFIAIALAVTFVYIYGFVRINQVDREIKKAEGLNVSLIQGNIDQSVKWDNFFQKRILDFYTQLSLDNSPGDKGLLVWPETALPFNFQNTGNMRQQVMDLPQKTNAWFIFGAVSYEHKKESTNYLNSAYLLSPEGSIKGRYDKVHLVPYGEYVPLRNIFPFIKKLTEGIGDFARGKGYEPLEMDERKIGVLICYEGILPHAARAYKNKDVDLLVNITNDAWFGSTSAPFQHFSMTMFRAIETRLYLARAANTGISGVVDARGKVILQTDIFEADALKAEVKYIDITTIYARCGDLFVLLCFLFVLLCLLLIWKGRLKNDDRKYTGKNK
ncbi:MAG TPA: apolipoprotein N-acyltransferase [Deltaproteobacteria bacterium]|nr:apolipoprotein N-acyltransferase [Deltaproteobacteria bacterium]